MIIDAVATRKIPFEQLGNLVGMRHGVYEDEPGREKVLVSPAMLSLLNDPDTREKTLKSLIVVTREGLRRAEELLK